MKKHLRILAFTIVIHQLSIINCNAQWVSIPDTNFGSWVNYYVSYTCVQGDNQVGWQLDTTCPYIVNATSVYCNNYHVGRRIQNLTGIEYFDNLDSLDCSNNDNPIIFPSLPGGITYFNCSYNELTSLPALPAGLTTLVCTQNQLTSLPALPSLTYLNCFNNQLTSLPALPSLTYLNCFYNQLTSLPAMGNLITLNCSSNQLTSLPTLPVSLVTLYCMGNQLTSLPALPGSLAALWCGVNQLTSLPVLPASLNWFGCDRNQLTSLPALPANLVGLDCFDNQLTSLPVLPTGLTYVSCENNQLTSLPTLPDSLESLYCVSNQLTSLPALPRKLLDLYCTSNQLTSLPALPPNLWWLYCDSNQLTALPELPDSIDQLYCNDNPQLSCLPRLKKIRDFYFVNTGITCLPNYPLSNVWSEPSLDSVPLCDVFNSNGCDVLWNISGKTYHDANSNCVDELSDAPQRNMKVQLWSGGILQQQTFTGGEGLYSFDTDNFGNYEVSIDTTGTPFYVFCPANNLLLDTITAIDSLDYNKDFAIACTNGFDLGAWSIFGTRFRPAGFTNVDIDAGDITNFYGANCASGVSGAVSVTMSGSVTYMYPASGALTPTVSGSVLTYNVADFGSVNFNTDFNIIVQTDTTAVLGSQVCLTVSVTPTNGDYNPDNNTLAHCFTVVGSFDPNDKQVYPIDYIEPGQEWLTYTIRFQNTGTAEAQHIYITDTLDSDLDVSSFQLLAYSHQPLIQLRENAVRFNFPNINLPDSNTNEPLSHGYVQYKIKLKDNLIPGTQINNTAFIYFDYNAPVLTNTTTNTIATITAVSNRESSTAIRLYPNPANDVVTISIDENMIGSTATITDIMGRNMAAVQLQTTNHKLQTGNLSSGVYFVTVTAIEGGSATKKLVIQK